MRAFFKIINDWVTLINCNLSKQHKNGGQNHGKESSCNLDDICSYLGLWEKEYKARGKGFGWNVGCGITDPLLWFHFRSDFTEVTTDSASFSTLIWTFEADNDFHYDITLLGQDFLSGIGTWSADGDQLAITMTIFDEEIEEIYTYKLEGVELTVTEELDPVEGEEDWKVWCFLDDETLEDNTYMWSSV